MQNAISSLIKKLSAPFHLLRISTLVAAVFSVTGCYSSSVEPLRFELQYQAPPGRGVYVVGSHELVGRGDVRRAVRLIPSREADVWRLDIQFPRGAEFQYRYLLRSDDHAGIPNETNAVMLSDDQAVRMDGKVPGTPAASSLSAAILSPPRVVKMLTPSGSLSERALYIYLPRGYRQNSHLDYPVIIMHDGQNCFQEYAGDSFAGSWRADEIATRLIDEGRMRPCIIVAVANGAERRLGEYMPPWSCYRQSCGEGDRVLGYYFNELLPWLRENYRVAEGRENVATVGSSLGGLMAVYAAMEFSDSARHHAALSPALWVTREDENDLVPNIFERYAGSPGPDVRIWLDSGTGDGTAESSDDMENTLKMRDLLIDCGLVMGHDLMHIIEPGGVHNEASWSHRLDRVFEFLYPAG